MKQRKIKYASASAKKAALEAEAYRIDRDKRLGISNKPIKQTSKEYVMNATYRGSDQKLASVPISGGICAKQRDKKYTGSLIVGVAVMHKSCLQPIINQQDAIDSARMRR